MENRNRMPGYASIAKLRSRFEKLCNSYRHALEKMWDLSPASGYWIGDEVGGLYDNDGFVTINLLDMIYVLEHDITWEEYEEWTQYNISAADFGLNRINLKSWHMGCPRVPKEAFDRLRGLRDDVEKAIDEVKSNGSY